MSTTVLHPEPSDELEAFFLQQRRRLNGRLTCSVQRIAEARLACDVSGVEIRKVCGVSLGAPGKGCRLTED